MNMEKLLGKLLQEAVGGQFGNAYDRQHHKKSANDSLLGSLTSQLASGKGLMTAIGLGVGAYEVFRTSGQRQEQPPQAAAPNWGAAPPAPGTSASPPPPPPPAAGPAQSPPAAPPPAAAPPGGDQDFACRLIRVMIAAAHADGTLDADEERSILDRLRGAELSQEEKMFLLEELHHPRSIAELTEGISSLRLTQAMYAVALSAIKVDTESERRWLDELGAALGLSEEIRRFIEETR